MWLKMDYQNITSCHKSQFSQYELFLPKILINKKKEKKPYKNLSVCVCVLKVWPSTVSLQVVRMQLRVCASPHDTCFIPRNDCSLSVF